jgi:glutathione synthase/RimK-type ligase-like ATP-grasp enzyme
MERGRLRPRGFESRIQGGSRRPNFFAMKRIALATSSNYPNLTDDDRLLLNPLRNRAIEAEPAVWNAPRDWSLYDAVIIRSCWDYHLQPERFLNWIARLETARIPILNSSQIIRWNTDKTYLRDLEVKGIAIVLTSWPESTSRISLAHKLRELAWPTAVVKPRISATAHRTQLVTADNAAAAQALFEDLLRDPGVMLQKFMDTIREGEWSLMFFGGRFSHAVLKKPKPGDFRVQNDFGGTRELADPPPHVLSSAVRAVEAAAPSLYARVDGVVDQGTFRLMELELIEPALFLGDQPQAATNFAEAVAAALR